MWLLRGVTSERFRFEGCGFWEVWLLSRGFYLFLLHTQKGSLRELPENDLKSLTNLSSSTKVMAMLRRPLGLTNRTPGRRTGPGPKTGTPSGCGRSWFGVVRGCIISPTIFPLLDHVGCVSIRTIPFFPYFLLNLSNYYYCIVPRRLVTLAPPP